MIRNQSGMLTVDFIFAMLIAAGMGVVLFAMSMTLTVVELTQYIAFSSARTMAAGHKTIGDQVSGAEAKFNSLTQKGKLGGLFSMGWFEVGKINIKYGGAAGTFRQDITTNTKDVDAFVGVSIPINMKVLEVQIPLLGRTGEDGDFKTNINAFILREPSQQECLDFLNAKKSALKDLPPAKTGTYDENAYVNMEDNGC